MRGAIPPVPNVFVAVTTFRHVLVMLYSVNQSFCLAPHRLLGLAVPGLMCYRIQAVLRRHLRFTAGGWRWLKLNEESVQVPKFLVPFQCGLFLPFLSLSAFASILKENGKHYFVIRGSFSLHVHARLLAT